MSSLAEVLEVESKRNNRGLAKTRGSFASSEIRDRAIRSQMVFNSDTIYISKHAINSLDLANYCIEAPVVVTSN
jgi:hypothetical protein